VQPPTPAEDEFTTRLQFNRRREVASKLLVIVVFEGVVGDTFKKDMWSDEPTELHLRPAAIQALKKLSENFQLALVLLSDRTNFSRFDALCYNDDFAFDAVYRSNNAARWGAKSLKDSRHVQDYCQVYKDFNIDSDVLCSVIVVASIAIDPDELTTNTTADVIYWSGPFGAKKFLM
jgi:hypothetical protein